MNIFRGFLDKTALRCYNFLAIRELDETQAERESAFISYKANQSELLQCKRTITTKEGFNIPITEIKTDNFIEVFNTLNQIMPGISPIRIRETRRIIKKIVDRSVSSEEPESVIIGIDDLSNIDLS